MTLPGCFCPTQKVGSLTVDLLVTADAQLLRIVSSVSTLAWSNSTPAELTVREVVDHIVAGNVFAARLLAGASATAAVAGLDTDQLGDDPLRVLASSCEAQTAAFAESDQSQALHHPSGDITYQTFLRFRLGDLVVHSWDIAIGAGLEPTLEATLVDGLWTMVEPHLDEMRARGTFGAGASGNLPPSASTQDRVLDAFGRRP